MDYPFHVLKSKEQIEVLYKLFQMKEADKDKLENKIAKVLLPAGGVLQKELNYSEFILKIAEREELSLPVTATIPEKEKILFQKIIQKNLEQMPGEERLALQQELALKAKKEGLSNAEITSITSLATIGAAQLSGFGIY